MTDAASPDQTGPAIDPPTESIPVGIRKGGA